MNWWKGRDRESPGGPVHTLARMRDEFDRAFDRVLRAPIEGVWGNEQAWMPTIDVKEGETEVVVQAEIPGVQPKDVTVSLSGGVLMIAGQKEETREEHRDDYWMNERRFGSFRRAIPLPEGIDAENVVAEQDNGVLTVRVARLKSAKPRKITVRSTAKSQ